MRNKKKSDKKEQLKEQEQIAAEKEQQNETDTVESDQQAAEDSAAAETQSEPSVEEKIAALSDALAVSEDKNLRIQAEFQNYRKRSYKEINTARQAAIQDTVVPFLQVFDHFNMAVHAAENSNNMEAVLQGMEMILNEYSKALDELGIKKIDATGEIFDPELHEAVANEASDEVEEGRVIKQWACGYMLGEKLLRPAQVVVSSGPAVEESETADEDDAAASDKGMEE